MKVTVVTDDKGEFVGAIQGDCELIEVEGQTSISLSDEANPDFRAGVLVGPGQNMTEIQVSDELASLDPDEFIKIIKAHLKQ